MPFKANINPLKLRNLGTGIHYYKGQFVQLSCLIVLFVMQVQLSIGQDPIFSQYYNAPLVMNPGLAGLNDDPKIYLNYRNQWPGLPNAYRTFSASVDKYFDHLNSGFGALIVSDDAGNGIIKTNKISGIYSYRIPINKKHFVKGGFEVGVAQSRLDWDKLIFRDQIDAEFGPISPGGTPFPSTEIAPEGNSQIYMDFGLGVVYYNDFMYGGLSVKHLNTPNQSFLEINTNLQSGLPMRVSAQIGAELKIADFLRGRLPFYVAPSAIWVKQGPFKQLNVGSFLNLGAVGFGGWYRTSFTNSDAIIGAVSVTTGVFRISYSFDYTVSALNLNGGTHEIGIGINFDDGVTESIYNDCFNIFR